MKTKLAFLPLFAMVVVAVGCNPSAKETESVPSSGSDADPEAPIVMDGLPPSMDDVHDHPEHGPHGGDLVELGKEAFHAELVHGDDGVWIYVLDGSATQAVAIPSEKLVVSLKHDGQVETFELAANPDANDPAGQASRFTSSDTTLDELFDSGCEGAVVIQIDGKSYTGKIAHDHLDRDDH